MTPEETLHPPEERAMIRRASPAPAFPLAEDRSFDPAWLVESLRREFPKELAIIAAAEGCTRFHFGSELKLYFVSTENANQPGADWQFSHSIVVESTPYGEVVLDMLDDGRLGGIEFLDRVYLAEREGRLQ